MTGPQGGSWIPLGGQLKDLWEKAIPGTTYQVFPGAGIELGFSAGIDDPVDAVLGPSARYRNRAGAVNLTWRRAPAVAGLEMRRIVTDYRNPDPLTARATHLHLGMGIEF